MSEFDSASGQRLVGSANIFHGENHLDGAWDRPTRPRERLAQAKCHSAAIQKREALMLALEHQPQLVAIEGHRARHLLNAEHYHADLTELEI